MSNILSINALDYSAEPKLIFTANTPDQKGLSHKSYTITLPISTKNNLLLNNLWGVGAFKTVSFEATYIVSGVELKGWLKITDVNKQEAKAIFVSGSGYLWERMAGDLMRDIDMSVEDIVLNRANVLASETGTPFVCFDLTDRGAFKSVDSIDITDRYPALNLVQTLTKVFAAYNTGLTIEDLQGDEYILFMQENEIRNSKEWKQNAVLEARPLKSGGTVPGNIKRYHTSGTIGSFTITEDLEFDDITSNKGLSWNATTNKYTALETGTYIFKMPYSFRLLRSQSTTDSFITVQLYNHTTASSIQSVFDTSGTGWSFDIKCLSGTLNSFPIELTAGDQIGAQIRWYGTTAAGSWELWIDHIITFETLTWDSTIDKIKSSISVDASMWYGADSTVEISKVLPDMGVLDFIRATVDYLSADLFYDDRQEVVTLRARDTILTDQSVTVWDAFSQIEEAQDTLLELATDKVQPPDNYYINVDGVSQITKKIDYGRTYIGQCGRVGLDSIPVLWNSGDPISFDQWYTPPEVKTRGSLRLLRKVNPITSSYTLTYGGEAANSETRTSVLTFEEIDVYSMHIKDAALVREYFTCYAKLDISKLQDLTYFKARLNLVDRFTGAYVGKINLLQAEQVEGSIFKLIGQSTVKYDIDTSDKFRAVGDANTFQGIGSGSSQTSTNTIPSDTWQSSVDAQISGLTEKTSPADADNFVIDDSADTNKKKRITWSYLKSALNNIFYGATPAQFFATAEKTTLTNADLIIIEDSASTPTAYAKKKVSWTNIKVFLKTYFDNIYYGNVAGQFNATPDKSTIVSNDIFIIEDSADTNKKKKVLFSVLKSVLGLWTAVTNGIKTSHRVGINADPSASEWLKVKGNVVIDGSDISSTYTVSVSGQYGLNVSSTGNSEATIQAYSSGGNIGVKSIADATVAGMFISKKAPAIQALRDSTSTNTPEIILSLLRETSGTAADGIGSLIQFGIENAAGSIVYPAYFGARLTNATTGACEIVFYLGSTVRAKLTDAFDFQLTEGNNIIPSNKAYYLGEKTTDGSWRMQISGSDLIMQRRIAGSWVTKNTITG